MKKILFILFLASCSLLSEAQFAKPVGAVTIPTYSFFRNPADSSITIYQGSVNLYNTFVQHFDTVKLSGWVNNRKLLKYRLIGDSILKDGTASNYKLLHKIDSIMALVKYRNDTIVLSGYFTQFDALQKRNLNNHDSLSVLDEKSYNSLTDKPNLNVYRLNNDHDSLSTLQEKSYNSLTDKPTLSIYRLNNDHDSLSTLQEKNYSSLDGKPDLTVYKLKSDSTASDGYTRRDRLATELFKKRALNNHDSLSTLDEKAYASLTGKPDLTVYRQLNNHDSLSTLDEKAYASLTGKPDLTVYRLLNNHDSLSTLDEKAYTSLTGKPDLTVYRYLNNHDSLSTLDEKSYNSLTDKPTIPNGALYRLLNNHDSLQYLDEKQHASLTNVLGRGSYHVSQAARDSINSSRQMGDTIRNVGSATVFDLKSYSSGTGTDGYIPNFHGTNTFEPSTIYTDGTNVGIGTINPASIVDIKSANNVEVISWRNGTNLLGSLGRALDGYYNSGALNLTSGGLGSVYLTGHGDSYLGLYGNFGVGTPTPHSALDVNGPIIYTGASGTPGSIYRYIGNAGTTTDFWYNVPTGGSHMFAIADVGKMTISSNGAVNIASTTASTSTTTGALTIAGGLGVNGASYFAAALTTPTINLSTDAVVNYFWKCTNSTTGAGAWASVSESQFYNGAWDANANSPSLADGGGAAQGTYYHCVVSGTVDFDGAGGRAAIAFTQYVDDVAYNGTIWEKVPNAQYALLVMSSSVLGGSKLGSGMEVGYEAADMLNIKNEDKGDITVSGSGSSSGRIWTIDSKTVTYSKIQDVSATDKVLGRVTSGAGDVEEISTTGSGNVVRATSPTLVTPALGIPASGVATNLTGTASALSIGGNAGTATALYNYGNYDGSDAAFPLAWWDNTGNTVGVHPMYQTNTLYYYPYTGKLFATSFSGAGTYLTGTAAALNIGGNAGTASATVAAVTFASSGGAAAGTTFNGSTARIIDYSTIGAQAALTNPLTGSGAGTSGYIPKYTGTYTLANSPLYTDGTNVGIGTMTPGSTLSFSAAFNTNYFALRADAGAQTGFYGFGAWGSGGNYGVGIWGGTSGSTPGTTNPSMLIDVIGNVSIGTVSPDPYKLYVNGISYFNGVISTATTGTSTDWNAKESALTFSTGLNRTGNTITSTITQYTDALARGAVSFTAGSGAYNSTTGVFTIPTNTNQLTNGAGFLTALHTIGVLTGQVWGYDSHPSTLANYGITETPWTSLGYVTGTVSHTHGNITYDGAIGSITGLPIITTTSGVLTVGSFGSTSGTFLEGRTFGTAANSATGDFAAAAHVGATGAAHGDATASVAGFMTAANYTKLGGIAAGATAYTDAMADARVVAGITGKEPTITAGTTSKYWRGDKTWQTLPAAGTGTVTSVAMSVPTGLSISGTPVTTSGTLALTLTSGYVIPTTTNISNLNTAYGWGNHASAGYATGTIYDATLTAAVSGSGLSISATPTFTANASSNKTITITSNATATNTASTIVLRDGSGNVSLTGTFCSSDSTLKKNIKPFSRVDLYNASKIDFRKFLFKADATDHQHYGVVYQQVKELIPAVTSISKETGKGEVNYTEMLVLVAAQQKEEIQLLKEQKLQTDQIIKALERRIEKLENHNKWEAKQINF